MKRETKSLQNIKRMCVGLALCPDSVLHKSTLVMRIYRDVVWMSAHRADIVREEASACWQGQGLETALAYLSEFAPTEQKQDFEAKVSSLFETKWLVGLIDSAMLRVYEYPVNGKLYFEILSKSYMTVLRYSEPELLEVFSLERSTFYERKREATILLGIALWGFAIPEVKEIIAEAAIPTKSRQCTDTLRTDFGLSRCYTVHGG